MNIYEYKFIEKIVKDISDRIDRVFLHVAKYPVGLQSRVQQVKLLLDEGSDYEVDMVGLYGIGGLGKSTLAKAIYNCVADQFEGVCFLEDVRKNSTPNNLVHLQETLILKTVGSDIKLGGVSEGITIIKHRLCRKKILLILDDVDKLEQLEALAGGLDWFGRGSRVIVTTRDKHLLTCHGIERTYAVKGLYGREALELLRWMAFKDKVPSGYEDILNRAVAYASGLPLVIEIVGSNLFGKSIEEWNGTLNGYENIPNKKIQEILKVSYDALEKEEQSVFLDIACCFKGCKWVEVKEILHAHYGHCIKHHVGVLVEKSLINHREYDSYVTLHNLIEDMGKEIVRQESPNKPGERSRLWFHNDIVHVLEENMGTGNIEIIYLNCPSMENVIDLNRKAFKKMTNLKTLIIKSGQFSKSPKYLPSTLRVLTWERYPSKSLSSSILSKKFKNMKVLTLDHCQYLTHIPNVSCFPNLEKFSFVKCENLITIDDSFRQLNKLEILNARLCNKLESFPPLRLPSLKELKLSGCKSLKSFPELLCKMTNIKQIWLSETSIRELPFSFQNLSELRDLTIYQDGMLSFSSNITMMPKLSKITAEGCRLLFPKHNDKMNSIVFSNVENLILEKTNLSDECLPIILKLFVNVKHLKLSDKNLKILPECLKECHLLRTLKLNDCISLEEIRGLPPNLEELSAFHCYSLTSSSRRMLLSQKLHEAGCTHIYLPNVTERIPDWFEHQIRGDTTSFWFRKEIPSISSIIILRNNHWVKLRVDLFVNGYEYNLSDRTSKNPRMEERILPYLDMVSNHTYLFDLKLEEMMKHYNRVFGNLVCELEKALFRNEWIHVKIHLLKIFPDLNNFGDDRQMGFHVLKEKRSAEENVIFTNPYGKRNLDEYQGSGNFRARNLLEASLSQFHPTLKKQRFVEVGVSEIESLQQKHLALLSLQQQMTLLPHQQSIDDLWNLVLNETKQKEQ